LDPVEEERLMSGASVDDRKFTDEEVREILKRAVEKGGSRSLARSEGVSLAELKAIGEEVGIDAQRLEEAAWAVARRGMHRPSTWLGAPTVLTFQRRVTGEVNPEDTPEILGTIRRIMGQQGEVDEIHGTLEWAVKGDVGERYVTLSSREGITTITSSANLTNAAILTYLPVGIIGLITSLVGLIKYVQDGSTVALVVCLAVLPILYPILRSIMKRISDSQSAKLERVVDELARLTDGSEMAPG
jgi:hypothetical protein